MRSSWLLVWTLRRKLLVCTALSFAVLFALVLVDMTPKNVEKALEVSFIAFMVSSVLGGVGLFHTALFGTPFPVTRRQLAWIPTVCLGIVYAAGFAGVLAGILALSIFGDAHYPLGEWDPFLRQIVRILPLLFLAFAMVDRLMRQMGIVALAFVVVAFQVMLGRFVGDQPAGLLSASALSPFAWPAHVALGIFFILEGPAHIGTMEHPTAPQSLLTDKTLRAPRAPRAPYRMPASRLLADMLMLVVGLLFAAELLSRMGDISALGKVGLFGRIYFAGLAAGILFWARNEWRNTRANGFSLEKTLAVTALKCSIVLYPVATALGAKQGALTTCSHCRRLKFAWAPNCPHCGHAGQGEKAQPLAFWRWKKPGESPLKRQRVSPRMLYRFLLPMYLVLFSLMNSDGYFHGESFTVLPARPGDQVALQQFRERLNGLDDARAWLTSDRDAPVTLPRSFRIEVWEWPGRSLEVECYCLRWEDAGDLGERVSTRLAQTAPEDILTVDDYIHKTDYRQGRTSRFALADFLDDRVHWVVK